MNNCGCCGAQSHTTYDFFGVEMLDCPARGVDRHFLARDLPADTVSGLRPLWFWVPYDPVTRELLDWNLPASLVHDKLYISQECSREEADRRWEEIANQIIATIQNRTMRDEWHRSTEIKYLTIRRMGWIPWQLRKARRALGLVS